MQVDQHLLEQLRRHDQFEFVITPEDKRCEYAKQYEEWIQQHLLDAIQKVDFATILQAKNYLLDSYMQRRYDAPKSHRHHISEQGHICIFRIFEYYYRQLRAAELNLKPTPIYNPPPLPTLPPPPLLPHIFVKAEAKDE